MSGSERIPRGLVILNTGHGKGKTTAALGALLRAWGQGMRVCVIQFVKHEAGNWGEVKAARKLGIEWHTTGDGFTHRSRDMERTIERARQAWALCQEKISSQEYDLIVLDEFTYPLNYAWLNAGEVVGWLREHKPPSLHLVITGRDAPAPLVEYADLVTAMTKVKHPFDRGVRAQAGIEF
jgi:cob(I)alamin adenosyltransferase